MRSFPSFLYRISNSPGPSTVVYWVLGLNTNVRRKLSLSLEECQLMLEEGTKDQLAELTYPFGRGVNLSFGIKDVSKLY